MTKKEAKKILENMRKDLIDYKGVNDISAEALYIAIKNMEELFTLYYGMAQLLADSLTDTYNKGHMSYSGACWAAHEVFRRKQFLQYGIYPEVKLIDENKILVLARLEEKNEKMEGLDENIN